MKTKDDESIGAQLEEALETMARCIEQVQGDPRIPGLDPGMRPAEARRLAARLRSGAFRPRDPGIPPEDLATLYDAAALKERVVSATFEVIRLCWLRSAWAEAQKRRRNFLASFHRLKNVAKAKDPESRTAVLLRRLHRWRRKAGRRSRKR